MCVSFLWSVKESAKERLPKRPKYIRKIKINCDATVRLRVIPVVIPTVQTADMTSNIASLSESGCIAQSASVALKVRSR